MRKIYLDYNATTPLLPEVREAMLPYLDTGFGNASSIHWAGREAKKAIEDARERIAEELGVDPDELVFTGSGTEANNLAILGTALGLENRRNQIITSSVEHSSVLNTIQYLEKKGFKIVKIGVDSRGMIDIDELKEKLTDNTLLVSIMHVNNETGNIFPVEKIGEITKSRGVLFHCDAVQSFGKLEVEPEEWNADLVSISAHKIYGPKGAGALYIKRSTRLSPLFYGGKQERGLRPGTENVPAIAGFGKACEIVCGTKKEWHIKYKKLMDRLSGRIFSEIKGAHLNGHPEERIPTTLNVSFDGVEGESIVMNLDLHGIAVSTGSACNAGAIEPSHVLLAMGLSEEQAEASVRFSIGRFNTEEDIDYTVDILKKVIERLREISPSHQKFVKRA